MARGHVHGAPSRAAVARHPIHPMLIPFPIAFLPAVLAADLAQAGTGDPFWGRAALWLLVAGLVTGVAAAVPGLIDFLLVPRAGAYAAGWIHAVGNALALALAGANLVLRLWEGPVIPWGLGLSGAVTVLLVVTGWYGGELSYRHGVGVADAEEDAGAGGGRDRDRRRVA